MDETKSEKKETLPVEVRAQMLQKETSLYFNLAKFEHAQRIATLFSSSTMVPTHFQGNVANCLIALNYADRLQADPFMVMQNMYVVHGRPGVEAKLIIALINQSGKYSEPLKYRFDGDGENYGCTAWTKEAKSGEMVEGPKVTRAMVRAEGWDSKAGTKWKTIPELMFRYRAASWFANVHCPELKLGMQTVEEINDFVDMQESKGKWEPTTEIVGPPKPIQFADEPEKKERKPRADKGKPRKSEPSPVPDRTPGDEPEEPQHGESAGVWSEADEFKALQEDLESYGETHKYHVFEAKKRTGITNARTIDEINQLLDSVRVVIAEKAKTD